MKEKIANSFLKVGEDGEKIKEQGSIRKKTRKLGKKKLILLSKKRRENKTTKQNEANINGKNKSRESG